MRVWACVGKSVGMAGMVGMVGMALVVSLCMTATSVGAEEEVAEEKAPAERVTSVEEVVVTAEKKEGLLQDTSIAIAAFTTGDIQQNGIEGLEDLYIVPSLQLAPFPSSSATPTMYIRGVGVVDSAQTTKSMGVGVYLDGVYLGRAQGLTMDLLDLERVEVLRGPQGTLYGRNTAGGAINFINAKPKGEWGFKQTLNFGNYDMFRSLTAIDFPELYGFSAKASYLRKSIDGWVKNPDQYGEDWYLTDNDAWRFDLAYDPIDVLHFSYAYDQSNIKNTGPYFQNLANGSDRVEHSLNLYTPPPSLEASDFEVEGHALTAAWDVMENMTLKSITSYRTLVVDNYQDYSDGFNLGFGYIIETDIDNKQITQELQLLGNAWENRIDYVAGFFYFDEDSTEIEAAFGGERIVDVENESWALYGQATLVPPILQDKMSLTLGLRYTEDEMTAVRTGNDPSFPPGSGDLSYDHIDPMFTIAYSWTDDISNYFKVATGFRAGGMNVRSDDMNEVFAPEEVVQYELGLKSTFFDRRLLTNVAAFYSDYTDMQLDFTPGVDLRQARTLNAADSNIWGIELDTTAVPVEGLTLGFNYAYLVAEFDGAVIDPISGEDVTDDFEIPNAPRHSYNASVQYEFPPTPFGIISARVAYDFTDKLKTGPVGQWHRPDYGLWNARATLSDIPTGGNGSLLFSLWGKNLADTEYINYRIGSQAYPIDAYGTPRTYGLDMTYEF